MLAHAFFEIYYINSLLLQNIPPKDYTFLGNLYCALPTAAQLVLLAGGIGGGFLSGVYFWRVIYVEKRYKKWGQ
jgi:hypothetical protein